MNTGLHEFLAQDRVIWGKPAAQAVLEEADRRSAHRLFIVTGRTLNRQTDVLTKIRTALGSRCVGTFDECREHTPRHSVMAAADAARAAEPDLIVSIGGGTVIDTVKVMLIALAHNLTQVDQLGDFHLRVNSDGSRHTPAIKPPPFRQIAVSTTLSAAEFSNFAGCVDTKRQVKDGYMAREIGPATVILDAEATLPTPEWLWHSTGIRAIDHAIEGICSIAPSPLVEAASVQALKLLSAALPRVKANPRDLPARLECLQGAWLAGMGILRVPYGASHGLGHSLGAVTGMSHGHTSCVMLAHVMRYNLDATRAQQQRVAAAMARLDGDAAAAVSALIAALELPSRLSELKVTRSQFDQIAQGAKDNLWVRTNPRPITTTGQLTELLEMAW